MLREERQKSDTHAAFGDGVPADQPASPPWWDGPCTQPQNRKATTANLSPRGHGCGGGLRAWQGGCHSSLVDFI